MCGKLICSNCVHKWKDNVEQFELILDCEAVVPFIGDNYLPICPHCLGTMHSNNSKYEWAESNCEDVEIVSANYKGHKKYIPNSEIYIISTSYRNREEAKHELRAMAKYYGRDMIIDCKCEKSNATMVTTFITNGDIQELQLIKNK